MLPGSSRFIVDPVAGIILQTELIIEGCSRALVWYCCGIYILYNQSLVNVCASITVRLTLLVGPGCIQEMLSGI